MPDTTLGRDRPRSASPKDLSKERFGPLGALVRERYGGRPAHGLAAARCSACLDQSRRAIEAGTPPQPVHPARPGKDLCAHHDPGDG